MQFISPRLLESEQAKQDVEDQYLAFADWCKTHSCSLAEVRVVLSLLGSCLAVLKQNDRLLFPLQDGKCDREDPGAATSDCVKVITSVTSRTYCRQRAQSWRPSHHCPPI